MKENQALIVVDVQNDFLETGALPVPGGSQVIGPINSLIPKFSTVVLTQDWHPADHASFACAHKGAKPYESVPFPYGEQILWPAHCVQGTRGAELASGLKQPSVSLCVKKGTNRDVDSYSAFLEADRKSLTGLARELRRLGITEVFVCGLATDFCVSWTALDAASAGFKTFVIEEASRGLDVGGSLKAARKAWDNAGIKLAAISDIA